MTYILSITATAVLAHELYISILRII